MIKSWRQMIYNHYICTVVVDYVDFSDGDSIAVVTTWLWRHNESDGVPIAGVSMVCPTICSGADESYTSKLRVTGLSEGNPSVTSGFPSQRDSNAENVSVWWRHHQYLSSRVTKKNDISLSLDVFRVVSTAWQHRIMYHVACAVGPFHMYYHYKTRNMVVILHVNLLQTNNHALVDDNYYHDALIQVNYSCMNTF